MVRTRPRRRDLWVRLRSNGIGFVKPDHHLDMRRVVRKHRALCPLRRASSARASTTAAPSAWPLVTTGRSRASTSPTRWCAAPAGPASRGSWGAAVDIVVGRVREAGGERFGLVMTARVMTSEVYWTAGRVARFVGPSNVGNAARIGHAPSTAGLKCMVGAGHEQICFTECNPLLARDASGLPDDNAIVEVRPV